MGSNGSSLAQSVRALGGFSFRLQHYGDSGDSFSWSFNFTVKQPVMHFIFIMDLCAAKWPS